MTHSDAFYDISSEWAMLAGYFEHPDYVNRSSVEIFTEERQPIFKAMQRAYAEYGKIDINGVRMQLRSDIPAQLFAAKPAHPRANLDNLVRLARKRQLYTNAQEMKDLANQFSPDEEAIRRVSDIRPIMAEEDASIVGGVQTFISNLNAKQSGTYKFADTGLTVLNTHMGGEWKPKSLGVILGGPGSGKTTLAINSMRRMAMLDNPVVSAMFSLEMSKEDLVVKWLGDMLNIDTKFIQSGDLTYEQSQRIDKALITIQELPMFIIEKSDITLNQMLYEMRKMIAAHNARVFFIDYLQIINHHPTGNSNSDLGEVAQILKAFAKRENVTIVILSQLTPGKEGVFAIRDSGEVAAVADFIMKIYPTDEGVTGPVVNVMIEWLKNRFGKLAKSAVLFNGSFQRFEDGLS